MPPAFIRRRLTVLCVMSAALLGLAGCSLLPAPQSDPTRYYVLTGGTLGEARPVKTAGALVLGLKRIEIVPYLNGKDMVVREHGNEIAYQSFSRWAEPLNVSINRTLIGRLASAETVARVYTQGFPFDVERDYDVAVRVLRCEGEHTDSGNYVASFSAVLEVAEAKAGGAVVLRKVFTSPATEWNGKDFGKLASALSDAVGALAAEVVAALPPAVPAK
jgi:uncharacterized protein